MHSALRLCLVATVAFLFTSAGFSQTGAAAVQGQVTDPSGALVPGATVRLAGPNGFERSVTTDGEGRYSFAAIPPGPYTIEATSPGFAVWEIQEMELAGGAATRLDIELTVTLERQTVEVTESSTVSVDPAASAGAIVLRGADLEALSDDPEDFAADLQALAGPAAGPNGGEIFIDGFTGGRLPPKESIREVRINSNPFSAEFDRLGFGRIEIFTRPGTDRFRGQMFYNFGHRALNTRNPFTPVQPDFQSQFFGGNVSGPLTGKSSFFIDVDRRHVDENEIIVGQTLDPSFNISPFNSAIVTPIRRTSISPRLDYALTPNHTLVARYSYQTSGAFNQGLSDFELPVRAFDSTREQHTLQLTETAILGPRAINEARFQYARSRNQQQSTALAPAINVQGAFFGGGGPFDLNFADQNRYEFHNNLSMVLGSHQLKVGGRLRGVQQATQSTTNFNGTFTFAGARVPLLGANLNPIQDPAGHFLFDQLSSIEIYRQTELLLASGMTPAQARALGYGPTQFTLSGGQPLAGVNQFDLGLYIQDDWRVRPNLTISSGLRYEAQTNIADRIDFAPRIGIAWAPGGSGGTPSSTVVRAGFGLFYDRVSEDLVLNAIRLNGMMQQQFVVRDPDFYPNVPSIAELQDARLPQAIRRIDSGLRSPYTIQWVAGVERRLPHNITIATNYVNSRGVHLLRSRNINAPFPGLGLRPYGADLGDLYLYESTGIYNQHQLMTNVQARISPAFSLFGYYVLGSARGDADGPNSFPANQYDLSTEYGRAAFDVRHRGFIGGSIAAPMRFQLSPFVTMSSGRPFNIITGRDLNNDGLFTERPAMAMDLNRPSVIHTQYGAFDLDPLPGQEMIARNFGDGPGLFSINLRLSRTWGWGERTTAAADSAAAAPSVGLRGVGGGRRGGGGGRGMRGSMGGGGSNRFNLTLSASARNLLNTVNLAPPVGNLSSPLFGQSVSTAGGFGRGGGGGSAGNRRIELQLRLSF